MLVIALLVLALIFFGAGFAFHALWVAAAIFGVLWLVAWFAAGGRTRV